MADLASCQESMASLAPYEGSHGLPTLLPRAVANLVSYWELGRPLRIREWLSDEPLGMESFGETVTYTDFGIINLAFLPWVSQRLLLQIKSQMGFIPPISQLPCFFLEIKEGGVIAFTFQESGIEAVLNKQASFGVFSF